jgi:signal transduction histidine kinase
VTVVENIQAEESTTARLFTRHFAVFESNAEKEKIRLSRALHDELGGLLVAAAMDVSWAEQHLVSSPEVRERLARIRAGLGSAIDLKRRLLEEIRPTLLENFGLIAALRWYHQEYCRSKKFTCTAEYPSDEVEFASTASNVLFRVVEEALTFATRQPSAQTAHLRIDTARDELSICVKHDGDVLDDKTREQADNVSAWLIEQRIKSLGGTVLMSHPANGGMLLDARVPLGNVTAPPAATA